MARNPEEEDLNEKFLRYEVHCIESYVDQEREPR